MAAATLSKTRSGESAGVEGVDAVLARSQRDFLYFAPRFLKIKDKQGAIVPFELNRPQVHLHERIEHQRATTGKVRCLSLKARQQGVSTYVQARFFHRVSMNCGVQAFVLTHLQDTTDKIFEITARYYQHMPVKPHLGASNAKQLKFDRLESGYAVATAGTKGAGRGGTAQLFHGSEAAWWPNAAEHLAGIKQTIPDEAGTEIILESTGNGIGDPFYQMWQAAESGASDYIPVFTPWYWSLEYTREVPDGFEFDVDERDYQDAHGITDGQLYWRHRKIQDDFLGDDNLFSQEYPATAVEAFIAGGDSFINGVSVLKARKATYEPIGALVIGVDPARFGDDSTGIVRRRGRQAFGHERLWGMSTMEVAGRVARIIQQEKPTNVFLDVVGLGAGVFDRLDELGYGGIVVPVNAGQRASEPTRFINLRAEMWQGAKSWIEDGAQIPDNDDFHADLTAPKYSRDSNQRLKIESKEDMRKRGIRSPDLADALAMTFAFPVQDADLATDRHHTAPRRIQRRGGLYR